MDVATWFAVFHVIQLVLVGLVALSVLLLADDFGRASTWVTRLGIGTFLVFFSAYDAVAGIGTGLAMRSARDLSATQQEGVFEVVKDWPGLGPPFALSIVGTPGGWSPWALSRWPRAARVPRDASGSCYGSRRSSCLVGTLSRAGHSPSAASSRPRCPMSFTRRAVFPGGSANAP